MFGSKLNWSASWPNGNLIPTDSNANAFEYVFRYSSMCVTESGNVMPKNGVKPRQACVCSGAGCRRYKQKTHNICGQSRWFSWCEIRFTKQPPPWQCKAHVWHLCAYAYACPFIARIILPKMTPASQRVKWTWNSVRLGREPTSCNVTK